MPADALAGLKRRAQFWFVVDQRAGDLKCAWQIARAAFIGERERLLRRQGESFRRRIVGHVAARSLRAEPFADVALGGAGARGEFGGRERPGSGHRFVQAQPLADDDERGVHRRTHVPDGFAEEVLKFGGVHCGGRSAHSRGRLREVSETAKSLSKDPASRSIFATQRRPKNHGASYSPRTTTRSLGCRLHQTFSPL